MSSLEFRNREIARCCAEDERLPRRAAILAIGGASLALWSSVAAVAASFVG
jgi:hypothetical protein